MASRRLVRRGCRAPSHKPAGRDSGAAGDELRVSVRGHYSADSVELVKDAGFSRACSTLSGVVRRRADVFQLPRLVVSDCDGAAFEARLRAAFPES